MTKDVLAMRQAGLSDDLIAARIKKNDHAFDLTVEEMLQLKKNGISDSLIKLLLDPNASVPVSKK